MTRQTVVIGLLGTNLDSPLGPSRWERWRPTVSICQHEDFLVSKLVILAERKFNKLVDVVTADIATVSPETRVERRQVHFRDPWDFQDVYGALHDFAAEYEFDSEREDYLLHITTGTHVAQICLFLLAESRHIPSRLLQTSPPTREAKGPGVSEAGAYRVIDLDLSRYDRIAQRFARERERGLSFLKAGIDTRNAAFNRIIERIEHVALHARDPILLTGPTGAGKSRLARRIYELKKQRRLVSGKYVEVNCATLRGDSAMSTLFGHRKGAFTGAVSDRPGLLREADQGLLMLDEIGELGHDEQAMLLRAIEEKAFLPLGADRESRSDFQLICGTNRDLRAEVRAGRFREDLLARINVWLFRLPGLAERREDIEPNITFELAQVATRSGSQTRFNKEAYERFREFSLSYEARWSGNFRDLAAAITRMATLSAGGRITLDIVEDEIAILRDAWSMPNGQAIGEPKTVPQAITSGDEFLRAILGTKRLAELDLFDRVQLSTVVEVCRASENLSAAGRALFAASRQHRSIQNDADRLRKYLARHKLDWERVTGPSSR